MRSNIVRITSALCSSSAISRTSNPRRSCSSRHHSFNHPRKNTPRAPTAPPSRTSRLTLRTPCANRGPLYGHLCPSHSGPRLWRLRLLRPRLRRLSRLPKGLQQLDASNGRPRCEQCSGALIFYKLRSEEHTSELQ